MIYDYILDSISGFLIDKNYFQDDQILLDGQIPSEQLNFFCRLNWTLGTTNPYTNTNFNQTAILSLDLFQRKFESTNNVYDYAVDIRKQLLSTYVLFKSNNQIGKLENISIQKTDNQNWDSYNLNISITILN